MGLGPENAIQVLNNSVTSAYFGLFQGGSISGYVKYNGVGVANAFLNLFEPIPGGAWAGGQTGGDGFYNITGARASANFVVQVQPPFGSGLSSAQQSNVVVTAGNTTYLNFSLSAGGAVIGYVRNASNTSQGIPYVSINAMEANACGPGCMMPVGWTMSNGSGYYALNGLATGTYMVEAHPSSDSVFASAQSTVSVIEGQNTTLNFTLTEGSRLFGNISCASDPAANVFVSAFSSSGGGGGPGGPGGNMEPGSFGFTQTDQNGQYAINGLSNDIFNMHVEVPPFAGLACSGANANDVQVNGNTARNFTLAAGGYIAGNVSGPSGPVAYAFVNAFVPPTEMGPPEAFGWAMTDAQGRYNMTVSPTTAREYRVFVESAYGSDLTSDESLANVTSGQTTWLNISMTEGGRITGTVIDSSGTPVSYAMIHAFSEVTFSFGWGGSAPDGTFEVRGMQPGSGYRVFIEPPFGTNSTMSIITGVTVPAGDAVDLGTVTLTSASGGINGTVTDTGSPVAGVNVNAWMHFTPYFGSSTTDGSGNYQISGLPAGEYDVQFFENGLPPQFNSTTVPNNTYSTVNAEMRPALYNVSGFAVNSSGGINTTGIWSHVGLWNDTTMFGMGDIAGEDGSYSILVPAGGYNLGAEYEGYFPNMTQIQVSANTTRNITLTLISSVTTYAVRGQLSSPTRATSNRTVALVDSNPSHFNAFILTNSSGGFSFGSVPASTYNVTAVIENETSTQGITVTNAGVALNFTFS